MMGVMLVMIVLILELLDKLMTESLKEETRFEARSLGE